MSDPNKQKKFRLGLALSGGGARGFAHIGAIKAIEEAGLKPNVLAGVSAGSIAAVLYSAGLDSEQILKLFRNKKFYHFAQINFRFDHENGIFGLDRFNEFLKKNLSPYVNLEDLPIPTYLGVTNFDKGVKAEFHTGEIAPRVVASCSIPICFPPVEIDGVNYVDGGVTRNLPSWILRDKCDALIGVNVSPVIRKAVPKSIFDTALRTFNLLSKGNQAADMSLCDLSIETPELAHYKVFDLKQINKVFLSGYATMRHALRDGGLEKINRILQQSSQTSTNI